MRTQRRQAREKEKQELMRQGLLEPPKPKVKISNLMRVLGEQATLDPTAIEQEVRRQMNERQAAHDDRNLARMLTPAEKRDKKMRKLLDTSDAGLTTLTSVYRVEDLSNGQHRFKVDVNAKENHMSGVFGCGFLKPSCYLGSVSPYICYSQHSIGSVCISQIGCHQRGKKMRKSLNTSDADEAYECVSG
eukprot:GHUV01044702.1.p1 GENE.GHUV01044702.1~~GHUV01044702.1.p1  ORF type:complete len:189 (+),score=13.04 GHUV01044702.1:152-718(+)